MIIDFLKNHGIELPFTDLPTLKTFVLEGVREQVLDFARFAEITTKEFVYLIIGIVVAAGLFVNSKLDLTDDACGDAPNNLYSVVCEKICLRFQRFYCSFHTVIGAQILISGINTVFTGLFLLIHFLFHLPFPYSTVILVVTFLCGLLPIIGNLMSNTVIVAVAMTQSPQLAIDSLIFLVVLHKFEYFLNSKIIGGRIKNPMWLTLLALLIGERLMGVPGMILAPVVLHYIKSECSKIAVTA